MTEPVERPLTQASHAFNEAIDSDIAGRKLYPDGAMFIDAEAPGAGKAIAEAAAEGRVVVLCSEDGSRRVLTPAPSAAA
ncbi:MAG: hypothetical protein WKF94_15250 [Solirubrobacteraceae bacterium]